MQPGFLELHTGLAQLLLPLHIYIPQISWEETTDASAAGAFASRRRLSLTFLSLNSPASLHKDVVYIVVVVVV